MIMSYVKNTLLDGLKFLSSDGVRSKDDANYFKEEFLNSFRDSDKVMLLTNYIAHAERLKQEHIAICKEIVPLRCDETRAWDKFIYDLKWQLEDLTDGGFEKTSRLEFSGDELEIITSNIEELKKAIKISAAENEALLKEVLFEIEDLKTHLYLKKKVYKDFFTGRLFRLIGEKVLDETLVRQITGAFFDDFPKLLE